MLDDHANSRVGTVASFGPFALAAAFVGARLLGAPVTALAFGVVVGGAFLLQAAVLVLAPSFAVRHGVQFPSLKDERDPPTTPAEARKEAKPVALVGLFALVLPFLPP